MKQSKRLLAVFLLIVMLITTMSGSFGNYTEASAAKKKKVTLKLSKKSVKLQQGKKATLKIKKKNVKKVKSIKWSVKNKKIAKVTKKGIVSAVKAGTTTLTCKVKYVAKGTKKTKKKTLKCKITVIKKAASHATKKPVVTLVPTPTQGADETPAPTPTQGTDETPAPTPTQGTVETLAPTPTRGPGEADSYDFSATALEFAANLGAGINIGNSLDSNTTIEKWVDAGGGTWVPSYMTDLYLSGSAGLNLETSWGCPKITKEYIDSIKEAGFNTIRLPVTYINHVKTETGSDGKKVYTVDQDWLNRVQEIVDWAIEDGLYVIINIHHDGADNYNEVDTNILNVYGGEQATWLSPLNNSEEAYTQMEEKFVSLWTQIATKFKDYSNQLIFADMNEFHHLYGAPEQSWYEVQNKLHQAFVNAVRATGSYNEGRYLVVPGYNTNINYTIAGLQLPTDIEANQTDHNGNKVGHIMAEVHYYDPSDYAGDEPKDTVWGSGSGNGSNSSWANESWLESQMQKMKTNFVDKGVPVILGEFGAPKHDTGMSEEEYAAFEETDMKYRIYYYSCVVKAAVENGLVPIAWDNGTTYELISRDGTIAQQSIVDSIIKYTKTPSETIAKPWE